MVSIVKLLQYILTSNLKRIFFEICLKLVKKSTDKTPECGKIKVTLVINSECVTFSALADSFAASLLLLSGFRLERRANFPTLRSNLEGFFRVKRTVYREKCRYFVLETVVYLRTETSYFRQNEHREAGEGETWKYQFGLR